jgi:chemotaxis protein histidine kinase CheA
VPSTSRFIAGVQVVGQDHQRLPRGVGAEQPKRQLAAGEIGFASPSGLPRSCRNAGAASKWLADRQEPVIRLLATVPGPVRWLDAVLTAPLPNVTWASSIITAIADVDTSAGGEKALSLLAPEPEHVAAQAATPDRPIAVQILTEQVRIVAIPGDPEALRRRMAAVEGTISSLLSGLDWSVREGELAAATAEAAGGMPEELQELIAGLGARVKRAAEGFTPAPASAAPPLASGTTTDAAQPTAGEATQVAHVLKVDQAKVDALMNLIAELVVSKNSLPFLAPGVQRTSTARARWGVKLRTNTPSSTVSPRRCSVPPWMCACSLYPMYSNFPAPGARPVAEAEQADRTQDRRRGHRPRQDHSRILG